MSKYLNKILYPKCPKILNTLHNTLLPKFYFLCICVGKENRVDPDQIAPEGAV